MTFKYDDENRERENYSWSTKIPFTYLSGSERGELTSCFSEMLSNVLEGVRVFSVGLILMILSAADPKSKLVCSWVPRKGEYIDLEKNVYFKKFYLPDDAAKPIDTPLCHKIESQIIPVPISPRLSETLKHIEKFAQKKDFQLGELLPPNATFIWNKLNKLLPEKLLKNRKGLSSFYSWLACAISERGDKNLAYSLTRFESFSSQHATYYPTYQKNEIVTIMCDVQESIFGLPVDRPEYVSGYVGSHLYLKDWVLHSWLEDFYKEFPIEDNWHRYDKEKLERYRNHYVYVVWIALASNFALRYSSTNVVTPLLNKKFDDLVKILDKEVNKAHPERYLPPTSITKEVVRHFCEVDKWIEKRFGLSIKEHQLTMVNLKQMDVELVTTEHINEVLFQGVEFQSNMIRHYMSSKMRERGNGALATILMGHRSDIVALPNPDILFSSAGGELKEEIEAIQSEVLGLRIELARSRRPQTAKAQYDVMVAKNCDALSTLWAMTKPQDVLSRISVDGARFEKHGGLNVFIHEINFIDFATDEDVALTQGLSEQEIASSAKQALKIAKQNRGLQIAANEHHRAHVEHYSHACNYLSEACLASLMIPTQQGDYSLPVRLASQVLLKCPKQKFARLDRLISKLTEHHSKPIKLLGTHLVQEFGLSSHVDELPEVLLSLIKAAYDSVEITIYSYMLNQMRKREAKSKRNIAPSTWSTESSKVFKTLLEMMNDDIEVSLLTFDEVESYRDEFYNEVKKNNTQETIDSMSYTVKGVFSLMGSEPCFYDGDNKAERKSTDKHLVWSYQYKLVLTAIAESDLLRQQKIIYRAAVVLMYKAGVRPAELQLITKGDILDCLRIASKYQARTKTLAGNRVVHFSGMLSKEEQAILQQVGDIPVKKRSDSPFQIVDLHWISHTLKAVTNNHEVSPYCLRYSFANFHYLLLMDVHLPVVQEYFECKDLTATLEELKSLWTIKGYENEAMLKALSLTLGHKDIATTMNYYICTLPLVRLYYRLTMPLLSGRQLAKQLQLPVSSYHQNKKRNAKSIGLEIGTHSIPFVPAQPELISVHWESHPEMSELDSLNIKIQAWKSLLSDKQARDYAVLKKEASNYGLTVNALSQALKQETTRKLIESFSKLSECERHELYQEWLSKCSPKVSLSSRLTSAGFIKAREALSLEFRVKDRIYVIQGKIVSLNKNIAAALLIVSSKIAEIS